jgi:Leucine-rich repeat (LRR) protein
MKGNRMHSKLFTSIGVILFACLSLLPSCGNSISQSASQNLSPHQKDSIVVRNLLDLNGLNAINVLDVASPDTGRITSIVAQYQEIDTISEEISQLNALRFLHLTYSSLKTLPNGIGNVNTLQYLNVSHGKLTSLPASIINLNLPNLGQSNQMYTGLFVENNSICNVSNEIKTWLNTYDSTWQSSQACN